MSAKLEKLAAAALAKLHEIRAPDSLCKAMGAVIDQLADVTERLDAIEKADNERAATRTFMIDVPTTNGAMLRGVEKATTGTMIDLDRVLNSVAGLVAKGR